MKKIILGISTLLLLVGCNSHYSVSGNDVVNMIKPKKKKIVSMWQPTDWHTVEKLVDGKTLIARSKRFCSDKDKTFNNKGCLKIAILESAKSRTDKRKLNSTIIYPSKKKIVKAKWGVGEFNIATTGLNIGIENIPIDSRRYPFERMVYLNQDGKHLKLINPATGEFIIVAISEGNNLKFLSDARNKNYKSINTRGNRTLSQVIGGGIATFAVKAMKSGSTNPQLVESEIPNKPSATIRKKYECTFKYSELSASEMKSIGNKITIYAKDYQEAMARGKSLLNKQAEGAFKVTSISCH